MAQFVDLDDSVSFVFQGVLSRYNGTWSLLMGTLIFYEKGDRHEQEAEAWQQHYPNFRFINGLRGEITVSDLMACLNEERRLSIPGLEDFAFERGNINWTESLTPSHASEGPFPEKCFTSRVCSDVYCHDSKLIAHELPFHTSAFEYIRQFLGLDTFHGNSDGRKGELSIKIPDLRGHITLSDQEAHFSAGNGESAATLMLVGAIDDKPVQLKPEERFWFERDKASNVELWLVTDSDEIIDYRSSSEWQYRLDTPTDSADSAKLFQIIASGESEYCEFKPYIDLVDNKNNKAWELDKTVCAFSNHQGGMLFIGVDDDTRITGINDRCQRHYSRDPRESVRLYQNAVEKRLQESLAKNQCLDVYLIDQDEQFVLVVEVQKVNGLNYLLKKNEAYIRRGASSPRMTLAEVRAFPKETDVLGRTL
ncbi:ATP-binding protein [Marinobacter alexandrii]|uniref:AlbA family DNA-binding domain-containing protein n=1 Tax=Marinobacter alexandrii TaxID=2570351 RepID=UPI001FFED694|nr:ATP-binding protein [Marinobacter alexandrii]MCK2147566.1 ATP-binding protein [Marinobacter alexandrii]